MTKLKKTNYKKNSKRLKNSRKTKRFSRKRRTIKKALYRSRKIRNYKRGSALLKFKSKKETNCRGHRTDIFTETINYEVKEDIQLGENIEKTKMIFNITFICEFEKNFAKNKFKINIKISPRNINQEIIIDDNKNKIYNTNEFIEEFRNKFEGLINKHSLMLIEGILKQEEFINLIEKIRSFFVVQKRKQEKKQKLIIKKKIEKDLEYLDKLQFFIGNIIKLNFKFSTLKLKDGSIKNDDVIYNLFLNLKKKTGLINQTKKFSPFGYKLDIQPYLSVAEGSIDTLDNVNLNNEKKSKSKLNKKILLDFNYFISETIKYKFIFLTNKQQKEKDIEKTKSYYNHLQAENKDIVFPFSKFEIIDFDKIDKDLLNLNNQITTKTDIKNNVNYYNFEYILYLLKQHIDKFHDILKKYKISDKKFNEVFSDYSEHTISNNRFLNIIKILRIILKDKVETLQKEINTPDEKFIHTFTNFVIKKYNLIRYKKEYLTEEDKVLKKFKELENEKIIIFLKNDNDKDIPKRLEVKLKIFYDGIKLISNKQNEFDFLTNDNIQNLLEEKDKQDLYKKLHNFAKTKINSLLPITGSSEDDFAYIDNLGFLVKSFQSLKKLKIYRKYQIQQEFNKLEKKEIFFQVYNKKNNKYTIKLKIKISEEGIKFINQNNKYQVFVFLTNAEIKNLIEDPIINEKIKNNAIQKLEFTNIKNKFDSVFDTNILEIININLFKNFIFLYQ